VIILVTRLNVISFGEATQKRTTRQTGSCLWRIPQFA